MKKEIFRGSGVAIATPFTDSGVNFVKLEELLEFHVANKTDAIIICGTTGESSTMTDDEHLATIKFAVDTIAGRIPVIAGTGVNDTSHSIRLSVHASEVGVDGVLCVTPYYNKTTQAGLVAHFTKIANSIQVPMILYNVPSRTNMNIDPATVGELAKVDNIVAIKECNFPQVAEVMCQVGPDFSVYSGEDGVLVPLLSMGGKGVISVMANIVPKHTHEMCELFFNGDLEGSRAMQLKLTPLVKAIFAEVSPIPLKAAMNLLGMNVGGCRLPLVDATEETVGKLKIALKDLGLL
jgi:4-hydroxy-tetrahydrodipicolinate synthase